MIDVMLERGVKRVFAVAIAWPGWARAGKTDEAALEALVSYGPRYAAALRGTRLGFARPGDVAGVRAVATARGTATTDFGAPDVPAPADDDDVGANDLKRLEAILRATWRTLDAASKRADGLELSKGPRGGGRSLEAVIDHVVGADASYVRMLGATVDGDASRIVQLREETLRALRRAVADGVPPSPRGGKRWTPRYFVRRSAWHVLDHAWEIEDRTPVG